MAKYNDTGFKVRGSSLTEAQEQGLLFDWAQIRQNQLPELGLLFHVPNGGSRHPAEAANLKRQGVKPGVPDLCLPVARGGFHGLFIEMKRKGGRPTELQSAWLVDLAEQGYKAVVCHGFEEAVEVLEEYLR